MLDIALPKGRLGNTVYELLDKAGFSCRELKEDGRRLVFENESTGVRYFLAKPSDVAVYVERGAADIGIVGRDILEEGGYDVYELLDLGIGKCRMSVAAKNGYIEDKTRPIRVATKFTNIAKRYYAGLGREADLIHLNGSVELAPIIGLSDVIVDIVESGKTLEQNGLGVLTSFMDISARLIANKASFKFKNPEIAAVKDGLIKVLAE